MQNQRESLNRVNSIAAKPGVIDNNSTLNAGIHRSSLKQPGIVRDLDILLKV
jgi:hypothetical protein